MAAFQISGAKTMTINAMGQFVQLLFAFGWPIEHSLPEKEGLPLNDLTPFLAILKHEILHALGLSKFESSVSDENGIFYIKSV